MKMIAKHATNMMKIKWNEIHGIYKREDTHSSRSTTNTTTTVPF